MPHRRVRRPLTAVVTTAALVTAALAVAPPAVGAVSADAPVVISEIYGGGGNTNAPFDRDFIELYNATDDAADLTGWSVQYASAAGSSWQTTPLTGVTIGAGQYLVVGEAFGANLALPDVAVGVSGTIAMSSTGGKVALVQSLTALTGSSAQALLPSVVDYVGWGGSTTDFAGSAAAPATSNTTSVARSVSNVNTADNAADFDDGAPTPGLPSTRPDPGTDPDPDPDPIEASIAGIQGTGAASPLVDKLVTTAGVVTAAYPTGGFNGYVIQTPGTGGALDLATHTASDAIFIFSSSTVGSVEIGDYVEVTGVVSEFFGLTEISVTDATGLEILTEAAAPVAPATVAWPGAVAQRESLESMLVQPQGAYTVSNTFNTNRFGEIGLAFGDQPLRQPTDVALPGSPEAAAVTVDNAARAVALDDGATTDFLLPANTPQTPAYVSLVEPVIVGTSVSFSKPVIVDWRNSAWKFNPTSQVVGDGSGTDPVVFSPYRTAAPENVGGDVTVASFNVLNYFTTLGAQGQTCIPFRDRTGDGVTVDTGCDQRGAWDPADLARQQEKIVSAINGLDASVVGLMEIENSARLGEQPDEATATLVAALNAAAGSDKWAYVPSSSELPDVALQDVITNAIIYQPSEVTRSGASRALGTQSQDGQAFGNAREPLAQAFRPTAGGERFLFVVNHFKSKGSAGPFPGDADAGDGQGASNASRVMQATALRDWVTTIQGDVDSVVLAGDFNSYGQEDPLRVLYDAGYVDAEQALEIDTSSYSFSGLSGSLDHILLNGAAHERATGGDIWNINSGEVISLEYSRYNYHGTLFHSPDPYRSSDHDPVIVGLAAGEDERAQTSTTLAARPPVHVNHAVASTLTATVTSDGPAPADGVVEFREDEVVVGTAAVSKGVATFTLPQDLARGTHTYTAVFVPADPETQRGSTSNPAQVRVIR